jgi:antigen flippase
MTIGMLQFVSMLLLFGRTKMVAVALGPAAVGAMSVIDKLTALVVQALSLSLPFAALRFLPAALRVEPAAQGRLYRQMLFVGLALILPATVVGAGLSAFAPQLWGAELSTRQTAVLLAFAGLPVIALAPFLTNAYAGVMDHGGSMRFTILHSAVLFLGGVAAAAGFGLAGYYGVYAALGAVLVAVAAARVARRTPVEGSRLRWRDLLRLPRPIWRFSAALMALTVAAPYAALYIQYTSLHLFGAAAAGVLQAAIGISLTVRTLLGAAHAVFLTPQVNRQGEPADRMAWANDFQRVTALLFVVVLPPLLLFSDLALRLLYSSAFTSASTFVALFVAAEVLTMLSGTYQSLIIAGDRMLFHVLQNLIAQGLMVATAALLLPRLGLAGAGVAALSAPIFLYASTLIFLRRAYGVRVSPQAARMVVLTAGILVLCGGLGARYPGLELGLLFGKLLGCAGVWIAALAVMPGEDRHRLRIGLAGVARRLASAKARPGRAV